MKIVLDLDDVLCNFVGVWNDWLFTKGYTDKVLTRNDILTYDYFYKTFGKQVHDFYLENPHNLYENYILPFDGSYEFIEWCCSTFDDVMVLSYATTKESQEAKAKFVESHFSLKNIMFSSSTIEKYTFTKDCILIDDYPYNVLKHVSMNDSYGICFNRNGENGWSGLHNHLPLLKNIVIDMNKYIDSESYDQTKEIIKGIIE